MSNLRNFQDQIALITFGITRTNAITKKICISCKEDAHEKLLTKLDIKEYHISGLCPKCYERIIN